MQATQHRGIIMEEQYDELSPYSEAFTYRGIEFKVYKGCTGLWSVYTSEYSTYGFLSKRSAYRWAIQHLDARARQDPSAGGAA
jgi:hypothetical protein